MTWKECVPASLKDNDTFMYFEEQSAWPVEVDCSLGCSPFGPPPELKPLLRLCEEAVSSYAYPARHLAEPVCRAWPKLIEPKQLIFGNGTDTLLVVLAKILASPKGQIVGMAPQFTDGLLHFQFSGMKSRVTFLEKPQYAIDLTTMVSQLTPEDSIFYLDRPHNPTGQIPPLDDVAHLLSRCDELGILLVADEAYGDFMDDAQSAMNLQSPNLVVLRSFSKGWGLAGIRAGYGRVGDADLVRWYNRCSPPFTMTAEALDLVPRALKLNYFLPSVRKVTTEIKTQVCRKIAEYPCLSTAVSDDSTPLLLLSHQDQQVNLYETLAQSGIATSPGGGFAGLNNSSVRIRVPAPTELSLFLSCFDRAMKTLQY